MTSNFKVYFIAFILIFLFVFGSSSGQANQDYDIAINVYLEGSDLMFYNQNGALIGNNSLTITSHVRYLFNVSSLEHSISFSIDTYEFEAIPNSYFTEIVEFLYIGNFSAICTEGCELVELNTIIRVNLHPSFEMEVTTVTETAGFATTIVTNYNYIDTTTVDETVTIRQIISGFLISLSAFSLLVLAIALRVKKV
jgi:hypothetical protein